MKRKSIPKIILSRIIGFIIFLVLLGILNMLIPYVQNQIFSQIISFFNSNIFLLFIIMIIGLMAEIFWALIFPLNALAPIFSAISSIFILAFIFRAWNFIESFTGSLISIPIPQYLIYVIVFWLVIIIGYIKVLASIGKFREKVEEDEEEKTIRKKREKVEWDDIGNEFKNLLYNIGRSFNDLFGKKK